MVVYYIAEWQAVKESTNHFTFARAQTCTAVIDEQSLVIINQTTCQVYHYELCIEQACTIYENQVIGYQQWNCVILGINYVKNINALINNKNYFCHNILYSTTTFLSLHCRQTKCFKALRLTHTYYSKLVFSKM